MEVVKVEKMGNERGIGTSERKGGISARTGIKGYGTIQKR